MKLKAVQFATIFLFALVTGVFWGTWFSLSRSITLITPSTFLEVGHTMIKNLAWPMRILMPLTILAAILSIMLLHRDNQTQPFRLAVAALLLFVVALIVTLSVNVPIDNLIKNWDLTNLPSNWEAIRDRWQLFHTIRTFVSLAASGCMIASGLSTDYSKVRPS